MGSGFQNKKGALIMICMECGATAEKGYTTDVTDLGNCLVIIRNVPCYKSKMAVKKAYVEYADGVK